MSEIIGWRGGVVEPLEEVAEWKETPVESAHYIWVGVSCNGCSFSIFLSAQSSIGSDYFAQFTHPCA